MYEIEVRNKASGRLMAREQPKSSPREALARAVQILSKAGGYMLSGCNNSVAGTWSTEVESVSLPFYVVIQNFRLVDANGSPVPSGQTVGPFPRLEIARGRCS